MALVDFIASKLPGWMRRSTYVHWSRLAEAISVGYDLLIEGLQEGRLASMPGQIEDPLLGGFLSVDALPSVGRDRRIQAGQDEPIWQYAQRLRAWRRSHRRAGAGPWLLDELQAVLRPNAPLVRMVSAQGRWWSRAADEGVFTFNTESGDGFALPATGIVPLGGGAIESGIAHGWVWGDDAETAEIFPIIYAPTPRIDEPLDYGDVAAIWGAEGLTWGSSASPETVSLIRSVVLTFRAAGVLAPAIIIAFDPTSFDPLAPALTPGYPDDGTWSLGTQIVDDGMGGFVIELTRNQTAAYWDGKLADELP